MKLGAGKEMDRKCVWDWLNNVYIDPSLSYIEYTDEEIRIFAHDALVLLYEQQELVRCKDCKHYNKPHSGCCENEIPHGYAETWFCADGERMGSE